MAPLFSHLSPQLQGGLPLSSRGPGGVPPAKGSVQQFLDLAFFFPYVTLNRSLQCLSLPPPQLPFTPFAGGIDEAHLVEVGHIGV